MVIPLISLLMDKIRKIQLESAEGILTKEALLKEADKRFKFLQNNKILVKSTLLDPRFKKVYLSPLTALEALKDIAYEMSENKNIEEDLVRPANDNVPEEACSKNEGFLEARKTIQISRV
ncbi:uncharacterized protein LOC133849958 [Drosophila sulfurigaster albostrigata]|uniref:uncharacterized protein LOC133849958 n=1 Tax=Drosophila sulfurigaster albostrigata TaxID=89887 RepID=UPI002D21AF7A|nr:uncharacterized protein LOC133849958 [Drosophila sulfurigaster albostrigata]